MRLSEAMRLGAMLHPQGFGQYVERSGRIVRTCALGASADAVRKSRLLTDTIEDLISRSWPWLDECPMVPCPAGCLVGVFRYNPSVIITHLNDQHRWTREQIADWVATLEPPEAPTADLPANETLARDGRPPVAASKS